MTDLSGAGGGKLRSAQTAALFLTQLPQVTGESPAGQLRDVASEISAELEKTEAGTRRAPAEDSRMTGLDDLFEDRSLLDLETERARAEDALDQLRTAGLDSYAVALVERRLHELTAQIRRCT